MLLSFITSLAYQIPMFLVCAVGVVVALVRYKDHPTVSLLVGGGCAIQVIASLSSLITRFAIPRLIEASGASYTSMSWLFTLTGIAHAGMEVLAWAMVLLAVFTNRKTPA